VPFPIENYGHRAILTSQAVWLDEATEDDRALHGKKPLQEKERQPVEKQTKISRTDPEGGLHGARRQAEGLLLS
jgi:hypothetical protein